MGTLQQRIVRGQNVAVCRERGCLPPCVHPQSHNGIRVLLSIAWKVSAFNSLPHIGWGVGEVSSYWLLLNALVTVCTVTSIQGMMCTDICTDGPMSFETTTVSFLQEPQKKTFKNSPDIDFSFFLKKISYLIKKWCHRLKNR